MYCSGCGHPIANHAVACEKCGQSVDGARAVPAPTPDPPLFVEPERRRSAVLPIVIVLGILFTTAGSFIRHQMERKSISDLSNTELARQLTSAEPIDNDLSWRDQRVMHALRATFADRLKFRKSQTEKMKALEPDMKLVYQPQSFSSAEKMQKSIDVLGQCRAIETENMAGLQKGPDTLRASLKQYNLSKSEEEEFTKTFSEGLLDSDLMKVAQQSFAAESAWIDATIDLYRFSLQYASQIGVNGGRVVIASAPIRKQFDEKLARSNNLRAEFVAWNQRMQEMRAEEMTRSGMPPADSAPQ